MKSNPLVSIITPCYNSENYLERYLKNILEQTYSNIELIIVNDGSKDRTEEITLSFVERFKDKGYSLIYIKQENKGLGGAINTALKYITGEYFTWCDSDNFYTNDYVQTKINFFLENPQYSIVRCDGYIVDDSNIHEIKSTMAKHNKDKYQEDMFENCLFVKNFHFGCAMLKTADFDKVNPTRDIYPSREGQNWQLLLPMFYYYKSGYIDKPMFYFVYRADSVSNCVQKQSLEKKYAQQSEHCKIILETLRFMKIPEGEEYSREIEIQYSKKIMSMAFYGYDSKRVQLEYKKLKALGTVDKETKRLGRFGKCRILIFGYRAIRRILRVL